MDTSSSSHPIAHPVATPVPAMGCGPIESAAQQAKRKARNYTSVFGLGGPRVGPRYEALRVQQWVQWITGQGDWVQVALVARSLGIGYEQCKRACRRLKIPRRYDYTRSGRAMMPLSSLPLLLDGCARSPISPSPSGFKGKRKRTPAYDCTAETASSMDMDT